MDEYHSYLLRYVYVPLAAVAGAITALASSKTAHATKADMFWTFLASFSFAIYVTPWIGVSWFGIKPDNYRAIAGLTYVFGSGSNILLPVLIDHFRNVVGSRKDEAQ